MILLFILKKRLKSPVKTYINNILYKQYIQIKHSVLHGDRIFYILHCFAHIGLLRAVLVHCDLYKELLLFASWFQRQLAAF